MAWFNDSVDAIVSDFKRIEKRLLDHANKHTSYALWRKRAADTHLVQAKVHEAEAERARKVAGNIKGLIT